MIENGVMPAIILVALVASVIIAYIENKEWN